MVGVEHGEKLHLRQGDREEATDLLRNVFAASGALAASERWIAYAVWCVVALHFTGLLPDLAASLEQTTAAMEEMSSSVRSNSENAKVTDDIAAAESALKALGSAGPDAVGPLLDLASSQPERAVPVASGFRCKTSC